jgi:hypothetical protein
VLTVEQLIALDPGRINRLRGVGLATRRELVGARRELRQRLGAPERRTTEVAEAPDVQSLDELVAQLVPRAYARNTGQVAGLRGLLGLDPVEGGGVWPSQTDVAAELGVTRARVAQIAAKGRERWRRLPAVTRLRDELCAALERLGGVASTVELERVVAADRGAADAEALPVLGRAAVRAAVETELSREAPRFTQRRAGDRVLLANVGEDAATRQRCLDYAIRLGHLADELASADTLAGPVEVRARLRAIKPPEPFRGLTPERLVTLAAEASTSAAVSARLELHPRGMAAQRAVALGRGALLGADRLAAEEVRRRIAARFPDAEPLPERPALDRVLSGAGVELRWNAREAAYVLPQRVALTDLTSHASSLDRLATAGATRLPPRTV